MTKNKTAAVSAEFIDRQNEIIQQIAQDNQGKQLYAVVDTYGCQQNEADSEILKGMLLGMGYNLVEDENVADIVILNSCAVREHAEQRVLGNVGALVHTKAKKREQIIAVCGCMAQRKGVADKIKSSFRHVDIVFGTHNLWRFPEILLQFSKTKKRVFAVEESDGVIAEGLPAQRKEPFKAWVSIMYGCNNFCSYCIVPYVRGRERSRKWQDILEQVQTLVAEGAKDITLLGQNVNSYGQDLDQGVDFSDLLCKINDIPGDFVVRFMTSHPKDATKKLFDTMAKCEKLARHIHLPVQSGSDKILQAMNRNYTQQSYLELLDYARQKMPGASVTTDIIVGYPGETHEDFMQTCALVERANFEGVFLFHYSKRSGTPAALLSDPTTKEEKRERFNTIQQLANQKSARLGEQYLGKSFRALVLECDPKKTLNLAAKLDSGRTVCFKGDPELLGSFVQVEVTNCLGWMLEGN